MAQFDVIDLGKIYDNQDRWRQNALNGRIQEMQMREVDRQIKSRNALNEAITAGWKPESVEMVEDRNTPLPGPTQNGQPLLGRTERRTPGGFNMQAIQTELVKRGLGSEAINFQMQQDQANKEMRKLMMEYQLKDALQNNQLSRAQAIFKEMAGGGGGGGYGTSFEVGPQGPKFGFDPSKAAETRMKEAEMRDKGIIPGIGSPGPRVPAGGAPVPAALRIIPGMENLSPVQRRELAAKQAETDMKNAGKAESIIGMIDKAESVMKYASGSTASSALNAAKGMFGVSDANTKANEQLKLISGWMVANVPRMEGPQSNYDVQNYKTMAAQVGDSSKPVGDRLASLKVLRELQLKYLNKPAATGGRFLGFE